MPSRRESPGRGSLIAILACLSASLLLADCGRRGAPEPPPDPSAPAPQSRRSSEGPSRTRGGSAAAATVDAPRTTAIATAPNALTENTPDDETPDDLGASISPQPAPPPRRRSRAYQVPKEPFILDPLL